MSYHSLVMPTSQNVNETCTLSSFPMAPHPHQSIVHIYIHGLRSGLTLRVFKKVSHAWTALHLMCVCHAICLQYVLSCSYLIIPSFLGDFFTATFQCPHQVERVGTLGDGGKWVCGLDCVAKQKHCMIYFFGLSLLYPLHAAEMVGCTTCTHANPTCYII